MPRPPAAAQRGPERFRPVPSGASSLRRGAWHPPGTAASRLRRALPLAAAEGSTLECSLGESPWNASAWGRGGWSRCRGTRAGGIGSRPLARRRGRRLAMQAWETARGCVGGGPDRASRCDPCRRFLHAPPPPHTPAPPCSAAEGPPLGVGARRSRASPLATKAKVNALLAGCRQAPRRFYNPLPAFQPVPRAGFRVKRAAQSITGPSQPPRTLARPPDSLPNHLIHERCLRLLPGPFRGPAGNDVSLSSPYLRCGRRRAWKRGLSHPERNDVVDFCARHDLSLRRHRVSPPVPGPVATTLLAGRKQRGPAAHCSVCDSAHFGSFASVCPPLRPGRGPTARQLPAASLSGQTRGRRLGWWRIRRGPGW